MSDEPWTTTHNPDLSAFGYADHFLVWSWRRIAAGESYVPLIAHEFRKVCGEDAAELFATTSTFLRALGYASRRHLRIGHPGSTALTDDERQILTLVAAAQWGDWPRFEAHVRWLAHTGLRDALGAAAHALGAALMVNGMRLSLPAVRGPVLCERERAPRSRDA